MFTVAFAPAGVLLGVIAAVVLVALVSVDSDLTGAFGAIAVVWLAVHQVPLSVADTPLGVLPLAPTAVLIWFVARLAAQATSTRDTSAQLRQILASAVAGPLVITMILLATAKDAATVIPLNAPLPAPSLAWVTGVHLVGASLGVGWGYLPRVKLAEPPMGEPRLAATESPIPDWAFAALKTGVRSGIWLFVLGGGLVVADMIVHWGRLSAGFDPQTGVIGLFGVLLLSVLYLPNLMVGSVDVLFGATVHLGATSVGLAQADIHQVPCLPIFTAIAPWHLGRGALVGLALPVIVGAWLGMQCSASDTSGLGARETRGVAESLRSTVCAAAITSTLVVIVSATVSGSVGVIGRWSVNVALLGVMAFVLLAVPGVIAAVGSAAPAALRRRRTTAPVVVISPSREQSAWGDSEAEDESPDESDDSPTGGSANSTRGRCPQQKPAQDRSCAEEDESANSQQAPRADPPGAGASAMPADEEGDRAE